MTSFKEATYSFCHLLEQKKDEKKPTLSYSHGERERERESPYFVEWVGKKEAWLLQILVFDMRNQLLEATREAEKA